MQIVSRERFEGFKRSHSDAAKALDSWWTVVESAKWRKFIDVKQVYGTASNVNDSVIFNIKGDAYRLTTEIDYTEQSVYLRLFESHADYTRRTKKRRGK